MNEPPARRASVVLRAGGALLAAVLALVLLPAAAHAAAPWSVSISSDWGDTVGGGHGYAFWDDGNAWMQAGASDGVIGVEVASTWRSAGFSLRFGAPDGESLAVGTYDHAVRESMQAPGQPWMEIPGCNTLTGSFTVKELERDAAGGIARLWLTFEQHCEGETPAIFGEVRIGAPVATIPSSVRWPDREVGRASSAVAVTYLASAPTTIASASLSGPDASAFTITGDHCSGKPLAAGDACEVWVQPTVPAAAGDSAATLTLAEEGGAVHPVSLARHVDGTLTEVAIKQDDGSWTAGGGVRRWTPDSAYVDTREYGDGKVYVGYRDIYGGTQFVASFGAPDGGPLAPGTYAVSDGATMLVPYGDPCGDVSGTFTVRELRRDAYGRIAALDITFAQQCSLARGTFFGALRVHASDATPFTWDTGPPPPPFPPAPTPVPPAATPSPVPAIRVPVPAPHAPPAWLAGLSATADGAHVHVKLTTGAAGTVAGTLRRCTSRRGCARGIEVARISAPVGAGREAITLKLRRRPQPGRYVLTLRLTTRDGQVSAPATSRPTFRAPVGKHGTQAR